MSRWLPRGLIPAVVFAMVWLYAAGSGRSVYPVSIAAAAAAGASVCWLWVDTCYLDEAPRWRLYRSATAWRTYDPRFARLAQEVAESSNQKAAVAAIHAHLVRVADRLLLDTYAVDRAADPAGARQVLGEPLATYLDAGPARERQVVTPRVLAALDRLESL